MKSGSEPLRDGHRKRKSAVREAPSEGAVAWFSQGLPPCTILALTVTGERGMDSKSGWMFMGAACSIVGCAQLLGIEDLPSLPDGGPALFDAALEDAASPSPAADAAAGDAAMADAAVADGGGALDAQPEPSCLSNPDYVEGLGDGHRYRRASTYATWQAARLACANDGAYLVVIEDEGESMHVRNVAGGGDRVWIGLSDLDEEATFVWVTGALLSYQNWGGGMPSNNEADDCVRMRGSGSSEWEVRACDMTHSFVCECDPDWAF